jgi:PhoH-like ATPase
LFLILTTKRQPWLDLPLTQTPLKKLYKANVWDISPRNKEQTFAIELLMDPEIEVVSLIGQAGSGKTLLAVAAGLEQVLGEKSLYKKLIVSRPNPTSR